MGLWIAVNNKSEHCTPYTVDLLSTNGFGTERVTGVMERKLPYSFERLVNVYKVRLNVYEIKRYAHPHWPVASVEFTRPIGFVVGSSVNSNLPGDCRLSYYDVFGCERLEYRYACVLSFEGRCYLLIQIQRSAMDSSSSRGQSPTVKRRRVGPRLPTVSSERESIVTFY